MSSDATTTADDPAGAATKNYLHRRPKKTKVPLTQQQLQARRPATAAAATDRQLSADFSGPSATSLSSSSSHHRPVLKPRQALLRLERQLSRRPDLLTPAEEAFASPWALRQRARALDALAGFDQLECCRIYGCWERVPSADTVAALLNSVEPPSPPPQPPPQPQQQVRQRDLRPVSCCPQRRRPQHCQPASLTLEALDFNSFAVCRVKNFNFPEEADAERTGKRQQQQSSLLRPVRRTAGTWDRYLVSSSCETPAMTAYSSYSCVSGVSDPRQLREQRLSAALAINSLPKPAPEITADAESPSGFNEIVSLHQPYCSK